MSSILLLVFLIIIIAMIEKTEAFSGMNSINSINNDNKRIGIIIVDHGSKRSAANNMLIEVTSYFR